MQKRGRRKLWLGVLGAAIAVMLLGAALNSARNWAGIAVTSDTSAARLALLSPAWRMVPEGVSVDQAGAMLLSGCDGVHDNMDYWAGVLAGRGHPGLIIDSHGPRGFDMLESWRLLCMGQLLPGAERAGDLAVALAATGRDRVVLLGASHGGWSVLEFLHHARDGTLPPGLSDWPAPPETLLGQIGAAVVIYPYCGVLNGAAQGDWTDMPPILMILAGQDELGVTPACQKMATRLRRLGARIDLVLYEDAGHGFEQQERAPLSLLDFRPDLRSAATGVVKDFLDRHGL